MTSILKYNLLLLFFHFVAILQAQIVPIIPKPNQIKLNEGKFNYSKGLDIKIIRGDETTKQIASQLTSFLESKNVKIDKYSITTLTINLTKDTAIAKDGYSLSITKNNIAISSSSNLGLFYGVQSAKQLFSHDTSKGKNITCADIIDEPQIKYRSLQLDAVSTFFKTNDIKKIIDELALIKMNNFHLVLAENNICRMQLKNYPTITKNDFYTQDELVELVQYANQRFIKILPQFNFSSTTILFANDSILLAQKKVIDEINAIFTNPYIHIGDFGINTDELISYIASKNKIAILYSNDARKSLSNNVVLQSTKSNKVIAELSATNKMIASPKPTCFFDNMVDWEDSKKSKTMQFLPINKVYKYDPNFTTNKNIIGVEAIVPTSQIKSYNELIYQIFPRLYALEECLWTKKSNKKLADFEKRLSIIGYLGKIEYKINMVKFK